MIRTYSSKLDGTHSFLFICAIHSCCHLDESSNIFSPWYKTTGTGMYKKLLRLVNYGFGSSPHNIYYVTPLFTNRCTHLPSKMAEFWSYVISDIPPKTSIELHIGHVNAIYTELM